MEILFVDSDHAVVIDPKGREEPDKKKEKKIFI